MHKYFIAGVILVFLTITTYSYLKPPSEFLIAPVTLNEQKRGSRLPSVTLVVYTNFSCEECLNLEKSLRQAIKDFPDDVGVVDRYLIDSSPLANEAALAAEAARNQGTYYIMHKKLFNLQEEWITEEDPYHAFLQYAKALSLHPGTFQGNYEDGRTGPLKIKFDTKIAKKMKYRTAPALFINDKYVPTPSSYEELEYAINEALEEAY